MNISVFITYLIFQADMVIAAATAAATFLGIFISIFAAIWLSNNIEPVDGREKDRACRIAKGTITFFIVSVCIAVFVPSTKTLIAMTVLPKISQIETVQELPADVLTWIRDQIKTKDE